MRSLNFLAVAILIMVSANGSAYESTTEKNEATVNKMGRTVEKAGHRVEEATCMEGDLKCAEKKIDNRAEEAKGALKDKSTEIKNKVDNADE
jgi:hypothetical protein